MVFTPGGVEPPVFRHAECRVVGPLLRVVDPPRVHGSYLEDEVRRFPPLLEGIAVLVDDAGAIHAEGD